MGVANPGLAGEHVTVGGVSLVLSFIASENLTSGLTGSLLRGYRSAESTPSARALRLAWWARNLGSRPITGLVSLGQRWGLRRLHARRRTRDGWSVDADVEWVAAEVADQCRRSRLSGCDEHIAAGDSRPGLDDAGDRLPTIGRIYSPVHGNPSPGFGVLSFVKK
ncbi:MAG: hypothetical protein ABIO49_06430 [Dokdonella sp.]